MADQITRFVAEKLTKSQKRATKPTIAEAIDIFADQSMGPTEPRNAEELRNAQLNLAEMALHKEDPEEWLRDVLDSLGLRAEVIELDKAKKEPCWPFAGTKRGYNLHLRTYSHCCALCQDVRDAERKAKTASLGLAEGVIINERG